MIGKRIEAYRDALGMKQHELASRAKLSQGYLSEIESDKKLPSREMLLSLVENTDLSIDWLLTGEGPMRRGEAAGPVEGEYCYLPFRRQSASAGHGALVEDRQDEPRRMAFRRDWIDTHLHTTRSGLFLMAARGASMVPEIKNGDILLVDSNQTKIRTGDVYVWTYGEGENQEVIVKKAKRRSENGEEIIELISENKEFRGEDRIITDKNQHLFKNEGRVVWIGRTLE